MLFATLKQLVCRFVQNVSWLQCFYKISFIIFEYFAHYGVNDILIRLPTLLGVSQWVHINRSRTFCENLFLRNGSFTQRKIQFFLFEVTETAVYVWNFFKANYGQIHNSYNQFDKGYIRRLPVISLAEPCSARWTCLHGDGFPVFWDGRSFFIRFYKPRALHSLGNQRSAEPQGGYKDGSTAFKRYVTVAQPEELSLPSQNAPTTLFTLKMSIVSLLSSLYYSPDKYLLTASRGLTTLKIIKPYGI